MHLYNAFKSEGCGSIINIFFILLFDNKRFEMFCLNTASPSQSHDMTSDGYVNESNLS